MSIRVRAKVIRGEPKTVAGYYGHQRRYEGDAFEIEQESEFSTRWMERDLEAGRAPAPDVIAQRDAKEHAALEHRASMKRAAVER